MANRHIIFGYKLSILFIEINDTVATTKAKTKQKLQRLAKNFEQTDAGANAIKNITTPPRLCWW